MSNEVDSLKQKVQELELQVALMDKQCKELSDLLPQMVYDLDSTGKYTYINRCGYQMFGYDCKDFEKGLYIKDLLEEKSASEATSALNRILSGGDSSKGKRYLARKKSGEIFPIVVYSAPVRKDNVIIGVRGICIDHTECEIVLTDLQTSQNNFQTLSLQYQFLLDTIPDMVWTKDINNRFTFVNKAMRDTLQKETDEIIGKSMFDIAEEVDDSVLNSDEIAKNMQTCHFIESFKVNGNEVWLDVTKAPIVQSGVLVGTIGTARDITCKIENERLLKTYISKEVAEWQENQRAGFARVDLCLERMRARFA